MRIIAILLFLTIFSCKNKKDQEIIEKSETSQNQTTPNVSSGIKEIESLSFRRTYVGHEKVSDRELDKLLKSNPSLETYDINSKVVKKLNSLNILKNTDLILQNFENKKLKKEYLDDKNKIEIECKYDSIYLSKIDLTVKEGDRTEMKTLDFGSDSIVGIILQDIDDDHVKEILVLTNYYIMNGDNFLLKILKYQ